MAAMPAADSNCGLHGLPVLCPWPSNHRHSRQIPDFGRRNDRIVSLRRIVHMRKLMIAAIWPAVALSLSESAWAQNQVTFRLRPQAQPVRLAEQAIEPAEPAPSGALPGEPVAPIGPLGAEPALSQDPIFASGGVPPYWSGPGGCGPNRCADAWAGYCAEQRGVGCGHSGRVTDYPFAGRASARCRVGFWCGWPPTVFAGHADQQAQSCHGRRRCGIDLLGLLRWTHPHCRKCTGSSDVKVPANKLPPDTGPVPPADPPARLDTPVVEPPKNRLPGEVQGRSPKARLL